MAHNRFDGKTALVTGGTSGMGLATARRLRDEGARVIVTGRDPARLAAAADDLGPEALAIANDTTDLAALDALFDTVQVRYGRLDVLFVNAGVGFFPPTDAVTEADFDRVVGVNLKGVFFTIQKAIPLLSSSAAVVINASWALHRGMPDPVHRLDLCQRPGGVEAPPGAFDEDSGVDLQMKMTVRVPGS